MTPTNGSEESSGVLFSRPEDESLESFKAWIAGMFEHITGMPILPENDMSEEVWREQHAEFWRRIHAARTEAGR